MFVNRAPQWSSDEKICARFLNGDVLFYENSNFDNIVYRIKGLKLNNYSISPGNQPVNILCFLPGTYIIYLLFMLCSVVRQRILMGMDYCRYLGKLYTFS